jgi:hypothetical protein
MARLVVTLAQVLLLVVQPRVCACTPIGSADAGRETRRTDAVCCRDCAHDHESDPAAATGESPHPRPTDHSPSCPTRQPSLSVGRAATVLPSWVVDPAPAGPVWEEAPAVAAPGIVRAADGPDPPLLPLYLSLRVLRI